MSNSLDPDQARQIFVGPDLGPICLQRSAAATKLAADQDCLNVLKM